MKADTPYGQPVIDKERQRVADTFLSLGHKRPVSSPLYEGIA